MSSKGAPIAITGIDVEARPQKTRLKIRVSNVGGGDVFKESAEVIERCNPSNDKGLGFGEIDYVKLENIKIGGVVLSSANCNPLFNGYIRLTDGKASITCDYDISKENENSAYTTPMTVSLVYGYRSSISKNIQIINSP